MMRDVDTLLHHRDGYHGRAGYQNLEFVMTKGEFDALSGT